ncbi:HdeD family acid-resistance protein [Streptomyces otsuchiensis]|uniref:HdeD family acid-resistance protein n=1 Tax=Streptomyces otsuchiensis TaxID=2681388 RepID=UPI00102FD041|nr:HdeD family acid-resistance protein [Streptomyces otsuchiensis]
MSHENPHAHDDGPGDGPEDRGGRGRVPSHLNPVPPLPPHLPPTGPGPAPGPTSGPASGPERAGPGEPREPWAAATAATPGTALLANLARGAWQALLAGGVAACLLGVIVLIWPGPTLVVAGVVFGLYLLVTGVVQLVAAFGTHITAAMRTLAFISGAVSVLLGLFCFRGATQSVLLLALWIGIGWLFRGITVTAAAVNDHQTPARGWQIFIGAVSAVAGVVLIVSPIESAVVLTVVAGIWLLALGATEIVTALRLRRGADVAGLR